MVISLRNIRTDVKGTYSLELLSSCGTTCFHAEIKTATFKAMYGCNFTSSQIQAHEWPAQGQRVWSMKGIDIPFHFSFGYYPKIIFKKKIIPLQINITLQR